MSVRRYAVLGAVATLLTFTGPTQAAQGARPGSFRSSRRCRMLRCRSRLTADE